MAGLHEHLAKHAPSASSSPPTNCRAWGSSPAVLFLCAAADITTLEAQIDRLVYARYGLPAEEIRIVEGKG